MTLRLPERKRPRSQFERSLPYHMPVSGTESVPQQLHARTQGCANYELSDTDHCFLGNILISKCKRGNYHTHRHTWNRDWLDLNVNVDGSAREHTKTHKCQTEIGRAGAIYFVRRKFCFLWRGGRNFGPGSRAQVMVRRQITRSICTRSYGWIRVLRLFNSISVISRRLYKVYM